MASPPAAESRARDWVQPRLEEQGLQRYLVTIRERWWLILLTVLLTTLAAVAYSQVAPKVYKSSASILVTPVSNSDQNLVGLGLIRDSNDPTRDVSTASTLITTTSVAQRVIERLKLDIDPTRLLDKVTAEPLAQSSIVTVRASEDTPESAAELANAFADEAVAERTEELRRQLDKTIPTLRAQLEQAPEPGGSGPLTQRVAALEALRGVPDPTLRVVTPAILPTSQSSPRPKLALAAGIFIGLILGFGGAFALQAIDPRIRREEQLRALFRLPILARIPRETRTRHAGALAPDRLSGPTAEAYRTLRTTLSAAKGSEFRSRSILVTGSSPSEGKSTTAINFAFSLVQAGHRVILIESDMRRPTVGTALGVRPQFGIESVLVGEATLEEALVTSPEYGPDLQLLLVDRPDPALSDRLALPTARQLVHDAEALADFVVIDSPPLTEIIDALPLAQEATDVLIVVRLGRSRSGKVVQLGEMLTQHGITPAGIALVGVDRPARDGYYYAEPSRSQRVSAG
jgi:capsular exopolysaccharide synthesis family protein